VFLDDDDDDVFAGGDALLGFNCCFLADLLDFGLVFRGSLPSVEDGGVLETHHCGVPLPVCLSTEGFVGLTLLAAPDTTGILLRTFPATGGTVALFATGDEYKAFRLPRMDLGLLF